LIGISELPYTREVMMENYAHYIISFNEKAPKAFPDILTSANAERLSEEEIRELIKYKPE
jgi:hypothetical protein